MNESPTNSAIEGDEARRMAESAETRASQMRLRRHRILVNVLRIGLVVVMLGGWELAGRFKWIDPFFFAMPSLIGEQI